MSMTSLSTSIAAKPNYIGGEWIPSTESKDNVNPSDLSDIVGRYAQADEAQARMAIDAAANSVAKWAATGPQARADMLECVAAELLARRSELGDLLAREEGKTIVEATAEVVRAGQIFRFFAGEALRLVGESLPSVRQGVNVEITREPVGVVAIITPWNFPLAIPAWKIAPALAWGNCVVFKPADLVPGSAWALAEIIARADFPPGVFNLVMGPGRRVGQTFIDHPSVNAISFTGSTTTGGQVMSAASRRFAKVQLEMGGKNSLVVLDDADLDIAVECAIDGAFYSTGQRCTATSRIILTPGVRARFMQEFCSRAERLVVGDARVQGTQIGPVADASQLAVDLKYIEIGQSEGARLVCGGKTRSLATRGHFFQPAIFDDVDPEMRIAREEIFGPVACVIDARDYEHALSLSNNTPFGLTAGICTSSLRHASHFKRQAQAGMVMVNVPTAGVDYHVPFGGRKGSSFGPREQGRYASEFFSTIKTAYTAA